MKKRFFLFAVLLLSLVALVVSRRASAESDDVLRTVKVGSLERRYEFHRPAKIETTKDISANDLMWEFFQKHALKPEASTKPESKP